MEKPAFDSKRDTLEKKFSVFRKQELSSIPAEEYINVVREAIEHHEDPDDNGPSFFSLTDDNELVAAQLAITNTLIIPIFEKQVHTATKGIERKLMLIAIREGEVLEPVTIDVKNLVSIEQFMKEVWGFKCRLYPVPKASKNLVDYITYMCQFIQEVHEYNYVGWSNIHKGVYITGSGPIGNHEENIVIGEDIHKEFQLRTVDISQRDAFLFSLEYMLKIAPPHVSYNCLSFMLLSLITSQLKEWQYCPQHSLMIQAPTGTGKTSMAKVYFNMYEKHLGNVGINFSATGPAIELELMYKRDITCLVDDIAPPVNAAERTITTKKLESILRSIGDNAGRKKLDFKRKQVAMNPSGLVAMTAELNVMNSKSSLARSIILKMEKGDIDFSILGHVQEHKYHFPTALNFYIKHMSTNLNGFLKQIQIRFLRHRKSLLQEDQEVHGRLIDAAAWLHAAFEMYIRYGEQKSYIAQKGADNLIQRHFKMLVTLISNQDQLLRMEDPTDLFIRALKELEATNSVRIADIKVKGRRNVVSGSDEINQRIIGYRDWKYIYFMPDTTFAQVKNYYSKQGMEYPGNLRLIYDTLQRSGLLVPDRNKDGTRTVRITVNSNRIEVIRIDLDKYQHWVNGKYESPYQYNDQDLAR